MPGFMLLYATFACKHFMHWLYASLLVSAFGTAGVMEMVTVSAFELHDVLIGSANAGTRRTGGCALCRLMLWLYSALCSASLCVRGVPPRKINKNMISLEKKQKYYCETSQALCSLMPAFMSLLCASFIPVFMLSPYASGHKNWECFRD